MRSELALLSLLVCGCITAPAPQPKEAPRPQQEPADLGKLTPVLPPPPIVVHVSTDSIELDGVAQATDSEALASALAGAKGDTVVIRGDATAEDSLLVVAVMAAQKEALRELRLELPDLKATLRDAHVRKMDEKYDGTLSVFVTSTPSVWYVNREGKFEDLARWSSRSATDPSLKAKLERVCQAGCEARLSVNSDQPFVQNLRAWFQLIAASDGTIRADGVWITSVTSGEKPKATSSLRTEVAGRLPPELIQMIVRAHFHDFRKCYEMGLSHNPSLEGKISARFVIERDGRVSSASDGGSDIPDPAVRDCVIDKFKTFVFPAPDGGIVTVVYPIMLAPG